MVCFKQITLVSRVLIAFTIQIFPFHPDYNIASLQVELKQRKLKRLNSSDKIKKGSNNRI